MKPTQVDQDVQIETGQIVKQSFLEKLNEIQDEYDAIKNIITPIYIKLGYSTIDILKITMHLHSEINRRLK